MKNIRILGIIAAAVLLIIIVLFAAFAFFGVFTGKIPENKLPEISVEPSGEMISPSLWQTSETAGDITATVKTGLGDIVIKLGSCPAAEKFIELDNSGVFEGAGFDILAKDMFIQTGFDGEGFYADKTEYSCIKGAVGFVLEDEKAYPSLFIITGEDLSSEYDGKTLVFGQVVSGMETVLAIEEGESSGYAGGYLAKEPVKINSIEISYPTEPTIDD